MLDPGLALDLDPGLNQRVSEAMPHPALLDRNGALAPVRYPFINFMMSFQQMTNMQAMSMDLMYAPFEQEVLTLGGYIVGQATMIRQFDAVWPDPEGAGRVHQADALQVANGQTTLQQSFLRNIGDVWNCDDLTGVYVPFTDRYQGRLLDFFKRNQDAKNAE